MADSAALSPHTESSPLKPPAFAVPRAENAVKVFEYPELFDAVVTRPTTLYGRSGSYYGVLFELATEGQKEGVLRLPAHAKTVLHATHVNDCAEAYVRLAEADQETVAGQCYNISGWRYETLEKVAGALVKEYGIEGGVRYEPQPEGDGSLDVVGMVTGFSQ